MTLGQVYHGTGQYAKAIEAYQSVRPKASRWVDAQTKVGRVLLGAEQDPRRKGMRKGPRPRPPSALDALNVALKARRDAGVLPADPDLLGNICDITDIQLETGKARAALALLEPSAQAATGAGSNGPSFSRLMAALLRAHINAGQIEEAQADMAVLEKQGRANLAQLYFGLGKLLEAEMKVLKDKGIARVWRNGKPTT